MIECSSMMENEQKISDELIEYVNYCYSYTEMYNCQRKNNFIIYNIPYNYKCPNKLDIYKSIIASFFIIFIEELFSSIPWIIEYYSFYELILSLSITINNINQINNLSLKETNNTSIINEGNNENDNIENIEREPTETIIFENNNNSNNNITINNIYNNDILSIKSNIINNKNYTQNKIKLNQINESKNQLINNPNKDPISIINFNIKSKEQKK